MHLCRCRGAHCSTCDSDADLGLGLTDLELDDDVYCSDSEFDETPRQVSAYDAHQADDGYYYWRVVWCASDFTALYPLALSHARVLHYRTTSVRIQRLGQHIVLTLYVMRAVLCTDDFVRWGNYYTVCIYIYIGLIISRTDSRILTAKIASDRVWLFQGLESVARDRGKLNVNCDRIKLLIN